MKVTIIGAGAVGSTTAYSILSNKLASEIVLIDINKEKAIGEALDLVQATPLIMNSRVYAGEYEDAKGSDMVVITSGIGRKPGQTRLDLAQTNINILKAVATEIVKYAPKAFYIIVANPVDILTYAFLQYTGLPKSQVIGTGTLLDTIRLRTKLSEVFSINQKQIHANVFGEHGDTSFIAWSSATIGGIPLAQFESCISNKNIVHSPYTHEEVEDYVRKSGGTIISKKGCTVYGIATSVMHIIDSLKGSCENVFTISSYLNGEYGINDICLSTLALVGRDGVKTTIEQKLSTEELEKMQYSANTLKDIISKVNL